MDYPGIPPRGLSLARRVEEGIVIEADGRIVAVIELSEALPGKARIRIRAPRDVVIARSEIWQPATIDAPSDRGDAFDRRAALLAGGA